ncbi:hypothetical protein ACHHYP_00939 [Achlya hypogyna]|uniref:Uncharacterized protein n=1 Tax=Achlya hypogyna TaxID=1202772 RepID=A0A1V9Z9Y4_ACHHY|nr:hypothetical protein ACHHYP_00939 [Achlya hypogyna]
MSKAQYDLSAQLQAHLPSFLDALRDHQYKRAKESIPLETAGLYEWRLVANFLHMWADCDSTYHKMTYLQPEHLYNDTLRGLYLQLKTQSLVCAELLHFKRRDKAGSDSDLDKMGSAPMAKASTPTVAPSGYYDSLRFSYQSDQTVRDYRSSVGSVGSNLSEFDLSFETALTVRIIEYKAFLDQCSRYFEQRLLLVSFYLGLARERPHAHYLFDYVEKREFLLNIQHALRTLEHPLFQPLQRAATMEVLTIRAALHCETMLAEYNYLKSIIALHELKQQLSAWADVLDLVDDDDAPETIGELRVSRTSRNSDCLPATPPHGRLSIENPPHCKPNGITKLLKRGESTSNVLQQSSHSLSTSASVHLAPLDDDIVLPVYRWSKRLLASLTAKFTLYFNKWLDQIDAQMQPRGILPAPKAVPNHVGLVYMDFLDTFFSRNFLRDHNDSAQLMLVVDTSSLPHAGTGFHGQGYLCPPKPSVLKKPVVPAANRIRAANKTYFGKVSRYDEDVDGEFAPLWGVGSWPVVFSYPKADPPELFVKKHWPNLVMLLQELPSPDAKAKLKQSSPIGIHHEKKMGASYVIARVDPSVYLALVFERRKQSPTDKVLLDAMTLLLHSLQHITVYR